LANTLRLLDLPDDVLDLIGAGRLSKGHGKSLLALSDAAERSRLARRAVEAGWSVRQLERAISAHAQHRPESPDGVDDRAALARELTDRAAGSIDMPVAVRPRGDGFSVRLVAPDRAAVESVLARLARDAQT
jgi:ParB family chromosome partitioning protein